MLWLLAIYLLIYFSGLKYCSNCLIKEEENQEYTILLKNDPLFFRIYTYFQKRETLDIGFLCIEMIRFDVHRYVNVTFHCLSQSLRNMMTANTTDACETRDPCQHGGICISTDSGPICECRSGDYEGAYCEKGRLFYIRQLCCLRSLLLCAVSGNGWTDMPLVFALGFDP